MESIYCEVETSCQLEVSVKSNLKKQNSKSKLRIKELHKDNVEIFAHLLLEQ